MIILCKKYSMGVTGLFKVLYDIIQHEFENSYFFFLLYCSHFVIATTKTQKHTKIFLYQHTPVVTNKVCNIN